MTLDKARELLETHVSLGSGYNRNAAKMILGEIYRDHGQQGVDKLIGEFKLDEIWEFKVGTKFESVYK
jgi:hypothetical protein